MDATDNFYVSQVIVWVLERVRACPIHWVSAIPA